MWIARDKDGALCLYRVKPVKGFKAWVTNTTDGLLGEIDFELFPEIQWSDENPRELVLKPLNEEK